MFFIIWKIQMSQTRFAKTIENSYFILKTTTGEDEKRKNEPIIDQSKPAKEGRKSSPKSRSVNPRKRATTTLK